MRNILITGGSGFIGSHLTARLLRAGDVASVTVLDALTYAGHLDNLRPVLRSPRLSFVHGDICDAALVEDLMAGHDTVVHLAAESHVDRSFWAAGRFVRTNVLGTQTLLDAALRTGVQKFVHVSTDEVYGPIVSGAAAEDAPLRPTVPYASSKAASDLIARSYWHTHGLPVCITRSCNNYGPRQHPEKVIPLFVTRLLKGGKATLHGHGRHVRAWLHVEDNCRAIELVMRDGRPGEVYNIGGGTELSTEDLTALLLTVCGAGRDQVVHIPDRRSNDLRYAMTWEKIASELGFRPARPLDEGLAETVEWYRDNPDRWAPLERSVDAAARDLP